MIYKIALHHDEEGFSVSVPGLRGCWTQGATEAKALTNAAEAIREYLAARDDLLVESEVRELEIATALTSLIPVHINNLAPQIESH